MRVIHDLAAAVRSLASKPQIPIVAIFTLALGISSVTVVFTVVEGVLLRPLPYRDPERIVGIWQSLPARGIERQEVSPGNFLDLRERTRTLSEVAIAEPYGFDLSEGDSLPEDVNAWLVSEGFFRILGVAPMHGRGFDDADHREGAPATVILDHALWRERFGSDGDIVGRAILLDGKPVVVVGVMPGAFDFPGGRAMWAPRHTGENDRNRRGATYLTAVGRLRDGVSIEQASAELETIGSEMAREHPVVNHGMGWALTPLPEQIVGGVRSNLIILFGASTLVLLIACANVASLLLARATVRQREIAIRAALGATRRRLVADALIESFILSGAAASLALLLTLWLHDAVLALIPADLPRVREIGIDLPIFLFTIAVALVTTIVSGVAPALQTAALDPNRNLKGSASAVLPVRFRSFLVVFAVAVAIVLLIGAGLLIRSLHAVMQTDPGFASENTLALQVHVWDLYPEAGQQRAFFEETIERMRGIPGARAVGASSAVPFTSDSMDIESELLVEGRPEPAAGTEPTAFYTIVTRDYFRAMAIPLRKGRFFGLEDGSGSPPVALINEELARRIFPGEDPVGRRLRTRQMRALPSQSLEIVGVVGNVRNETLEHAPRPELYLSFDQFPFGSMAYVIRFNGDAGAVAAAARDQVWAVHPRQTISQVEVLEHLISATFGTRRFQLLLLGSFAAAALILATVGLYALISFSAAGRTQEIGTRLAIGADRLDILTLVLRQGLRLASIGVIAGLAVALAFSRVVDRMLFGIERTDPLTFAGVSVLIMVVAALASLIPARRAMKLDPTKALRWE
ncbi:MAG TPA: ABC transporter permease [Thermoanaerobaculia bacterium]|nr:ABC transporter permease [Thermoanaerobaculia bacterium]